LAGVPAGVAERVELLHRQRVHVGAQADGAIARAVLYDPDHARLAQAAVDGDPPFGELRRDHVGGAVLFEAELGMRVDVPPDGGDRRRLQRDGVEDVHPRSLAGIRENRAMKSTPTTVSPAAIELAQALVR